MPRFPPHLAVDLISENNHYHMQCISCVLVSKLLHHDAYWLLKHCMFLCGTEKLRICNGMRSSVILLVTSAVHVNMLALSFVLSVCSDIKSCNKYRLCKHCAAYSCVWVLDKGRGLKCTGTPGLTKPSVTGSTKGI